MAVSEVPVKRTPWTTPELLAAYATAWRVVVGTEPSRAALACLWGQACLECGRGGKSCFGWNVGNIMALGAYAGEYHVLRGAPECGDPDNLPKGATRLTHSHVACAPGKVPYLPAGGSRFRAYVSLVAGCMDKLRLYERQWPKALAALVAAQSPADAAAFVDGLLTPRRYFTADAAKYLWDVRSLAAECLRTTREEDWPGAAPVPSDAPDTLRDSPTGKSSEQIRAVDPGTAPDDWRPAFSTDALRAYLADEEPEGAA